MVSTQQHPPQADPSTPLFAGIDVGGTSIKIGLVTEEGHPLGFHSIPTHTQTPAEDAAERMGAALRSLLEELAIPVGQVARVGLATPGPIDTKNGVLVQPGNLPNWWGFPIRERVSDHCDLPVTFANDANAAAYGEYWQGAGREYDSMVLLTLGTGIGGGIIIDHKMIEGSHGCGSECGHLLIDLREDARRDSLGKSGSLEAHCSAYAVIARTEEALAAGQESSLQGREGQLSPLVVAQAAEQGDRLARQIVLETARYLGIGIVNVIHTIDPDGVILGGAMTFGGTGHPLGEEFLAGVRTETRRRIFRTLRDKVEIEFAALGGDAGFIGAAGLARLEHKNISEV
jgi:glucokinase